jgi:dTDP-4-amino-4,6-dideoxygalactose transaminase
MKEIYSLSKEYGFQILEDSSHAIGGEFNGEKIGSCQFSSLNVFSFHPVKIITTGEGGIITTNDKSLYEKLTLLRSHGITKDSNIMTKESEGPWYYQQLELGFNYRITDIQAALGISQLSQLDKFVDKRNELANRYNLLLSDLPVQIPLVSENRKSSFHLYVIRIDRSKVKKSHKIIFTELKEKGIGVQLHYIPVHLQPYYESIGFKLGDFPEAETYYNEAISLPMYYDLTFDDQNFVVQKLKEVIC